MVKPSDVAARLSASPWAEERRGHGAIITVQTPGGLYLHFDEGFGALIGRMQIARNGFDMIPPELAAEGADAMGKYVGRPYRGVFPFRSDAGSLHWCRFEADWIEGFLLCAYWPEPDRSQQRVHSEPL